MKKSLIITLYGNFNYGNKLQNYAVQEFLKEYNIETFTVTDYFVKSKIQKVFIFLKKIVKFIIPKHRKRMLYEKKREKNFKKFDLLIKKTKIKSINIHEMDYVFIGSDQIWNPNDVMAVDAIKYVNSLPKGKFKLIAFSASISVKNIPDDKLNIMSNHLKKVDYISVREERGKNIIAPILEDNKKVEVLLDPTMLVEIDCWEKIIQKPFQFDEKGFEEEKYIFTYFLGNIPKERDEEIKRIAKENNCRIINILDINDPFYTCGPSEFVWLEKHAFLVCTDSFHSCVFSILYKRPFVVFNREDGQKGENAMNSRIENLLTKFGFNDRYYNGCIDNNLLSLNSDNIDKVLSSEKTKAHNYIKNSIK